MTTVCPTVTAFDLHEYREQVERVAPFATDLHIDLMDGEFAPTVSPKLDQIWWPHTIQVDIHLMYQKPMEHIEQLIKLNPRTVIIPAEADVHHMHFAGELHKENIQAGLAVLQDTSIEQLQGILHSFDQILIFSGSLGRHGGVANLKLLEKVRLVKELHPEAEIAWDGGIDARNAGKLVDGGVDVLNVGGYIQKSDNPQSAYDKLLAVIKQ